MSVPPPDFLVHNAGDSVGVAVRDLQPGDVTGNYLTGDESLEIVINSSIPLGHKLALTPVGGGEDVIEYGVRIGTAAEDIARGDYVHVHNLRSARWQRSIV